MIRGMQRGCRRLARGFSSLSIKDRIQREREERLKLLSTVLPVNTTDGRPG